MKKTLYLVNIYNQVFSNTHETIYMCDTLKEAKEYKKLLQGCPRYQYAEIRIETK